MSNFKDGDLVVVDLEKIGGDVKVPLRGRVFGTFPGGVRIVDWEGGPGALSRWDLGEHLVRKATLAEMFKPGDVLLAVRRAVEKGTGYVVAEHTRVRMVVSDFSTDGTMAYSARAGDGGNVVSMNDDWDGIYLGDITDWENHFLASGNAASGSSGGSAAF